MGNFYPNNFGNGYQINTAQGRLTFDLKTYGSNWTDVNMFTIILLIDYWFMEYNLNMIVLSWSPDQTSCHAYIRTAGLEWTGFNVLPIDSGGSVFVFVLLCITLCPC